MYELKSVKLSTCAIGLSFCYILVKLTNGEVYRSKLRTNFGTSLPKQLLQIYASRIKYIAEKEKFRQTCWLVGR
jgi:hypothetical protein